MDWQKEKTNSNKVKSPVKRASEFTNRRSRENDKKRKKFVCYNFGEDEKEQLKKDGKKKKEIEIRDNLEEEKKKNIKKKSITKGKKQSVITLIIIKENS